MAKKVTRIKASDTPREKPAAEKPTLKKKVVAKDKKDEKVKAKKVETAIKAEKNAEKAKKAEENKKVFVLFRPFVALFRYLRDAFHEIRQVRWPGQKDTSKMVLAVFVYTLLFIVLITLLDLFFTWLFKLILGE